MIQEKGFYRRLSVMGPGGRKCSCCYPAPGPARREEERIVKKHERMVWKQVLRKELEEISAELSSKL